jgi:hypothetical protein
LSNIDGTYSLPRCPPGLGEDLPPPPSSAFVL